MRLYNPSFENEIRAIAQEIYKGSGRVEGRDLDNWAEAERIAIARYREKMLHEAEDNECGNMSFEWPESLKGVTICVQN